MTAAVTPDQALVYISVFANNSLILIVSQSKNKRPGSIKISSLELDSLTEDILQELLNGSEKGLDGWFKAYVQHQNNHVGWLKNIDEVTHHLWDSLMGPVVTHLKTLKVSKAVLIPFGFLSFLPLHAAWTEDSSMPTGRRYALDNIGLTYAPNTRSLAPTIDKSREATSLLAVGAPSPTKAISLPSAEREIEIATDYFQANHHVLKHEQATHEIVLAALSHYDVLHFACHGYANFDSSP